MFGEGDWRGLLIGIAGLWGRHGGDRVTIQALCVTNGEAVVEELLLLHHLMPVLLRYVHRPMLGRL